MPSVPRRAVAPLVASARDALGLTQAALGQALGASERTVQRWDAGRYAPSDDRLRMLARLVSVKDVALARQIALAAGETLENLGIAAPEPPAAAHQRRTLGDALVCAAAEAARVSPGRMRSGLAAAFARARELGVSAQELEALVAPPAAGAASAVSD
jgi:DNA-binding XRE family transcriptional regulator